jgi:hypothetical protein
MSSSASFSVGTRDDDEETQMKKILATTAVALGGSLLLPFPAAQADLTCRGDDQLSYADPVSTFFSKKDRDGDTWICVGVTVKKNGDQQLRYYDDI